MASPSASRLAGMSRATTHRPWAAASTVWLCAGPEKTGYHQTKGGIQTASDINITKRVDLHTYYKKDAFYVANDYALHTITVTA